MNQITAEIHPVFNNEMVQALNTKNIFTGMQFIDADTQQLLKITRLTFKEILEIKKNLQRKFAATPKNGFDHYKSILSKSTILSTGILSLDALLDGGLITGNIYEVCGLPLAGKSLLILTITANITLKTKQEVYIMDTKNDVVGRKLKQMLSHIDNGKSTECLNRIKILQTLTKHDFINALYDIKNKLAKNLKLRLVIVDSLSSLFFDSNNQMDNNILMNAIINIMRYIAVNHHVVFIITNLITRWRDGEREPVEKISGGKIWLTVPNTRLSITKQGNTFAVSILNSDFPVNQNNKISATCIFSSRGLEQLL